METLPVIESPKTKIGIRQLELRRELWPSAKPEHLWLRTVRDGFTTIPRTFPLIFQAMDSMSKGKPISSTYFDLWCRAYDECFVVLNKPREMAFAAGFTGQRAELTWQARISILNDLEFINTKPGPSGPLSYAIIWNPYKIIKKHREAGRISDDFYFALLGRAAEIGADDLTERVRSQPAPAPKVTKKITEVTRRRLAT